VIQNIWALNFKSITFCLSWEVGREGWPVRQQMLKYTLAREGEFYKGNLHTHTTLSDGAYDPESVVKLYRENGYDFLAITDHNKYGIFPEFNRDDFLIIPGIELDTIYEGRVHHIVGISEPETTDFSHGDIVTREFKAGKTPEQLVNFLAAKGNEVIYAHPFWSYAEPADVCAIKGMTGMEIFNYSCEKTWKSGLSEYFYDYLWRNDNRIWCFATDDAHMKRPGSGGDYCGGYITVRSPEFTHKGILKAIRSGSFYASSADIGKKAPEIRDFIVKDNIAKVSCSPCKGIHIIVSRGSFKPLFGTEGSPVEYSEYLLPANAEFVKAVCVGFDGYTSWSQPISLS